MATEKQRRRRAKEKRHDYDLVYLDEDGVERPVERDDGPRKPPGRLRRGTSVTKSQKTEPAGKGGRRGRVVQPPSWRKVLRRGAIFAPIFFATVMLLGGGKASFAGAILQTALLIGVFIPFSYFMDRVVWRQQQKRLARNA
jgi:hypothetical protein